MRRLQRATIVVAMLSTVGLFGAGVAQAQDDPFPGRHGKGHGWGHHHGKGHGWGHHHGKGHHHGHGWGHHQGHGWHGHGHLLGSR